ncbi:hypothetical protein [Streptomyces sp. XH2]|uniref:hypothetical protein n=1 Tax=Streptomyces sp. XH2 TaxID=3412483 RepID=UPI003C7B3138
MSLATYRRIWCDGPGSGALCGASFGLSLPGETGTELRRRATAEGWRQVTGKDLCPDFGQRSPRRSP